MMKESLAGATDGITKVQSLFSVNYRNTLSVLLLSLTQVNTSCDGSETEGSRWSHTSNKVTLTVSGELIITSYTGV